MSYFMIFKFAILIYAIVIHEYAHGWVALRCGDPTARDAGRLTFNPMPHIDTFGSIIIPGMLIMSGSGILFGWAKPVPVNPFLFKNRGVDDVKVSAAGPLANLILAFLSTIGMIIFVNSNILLELFNWSMNINLILAIFNMLPVAPLDGSHILAYLIPGNLKHVYFKVQKAGPIILMGLIMSGWYFGYSLLWTVLMPPFNFFKNILIDMFRYFTESGVISII